MASYGQDPEIVRFGPFELDLRTSWLTRQGRQERLALQPSRLLTLMVQRRGQLVTREELRSELWPDETFVDFDHGLNNAVNRLREALRDSATSPQYIETVPRRGYRFIAEVDLLRLPEPPASNGPTLTVMHEPTGADEILPEPAPVPFLTVSGQNEHQMVPLGTSLKATSVTDSKVGGGFLPENRAGIPRPGIQGPRWLMLAMCLSLVAIVCLWIRHRRVHVEEPIRSLAVLPLYDLSPGTREDYFADGMTDELITELARIPGLRVVSRTSVMQDKGARKSLPRIAQELGVDAIVEGSVVRSGDRVRITAQLIDARSDKHLWAQSYEGQLGDILSLQDNVAREISLQTTAVLTPAVKAELTNARHVNPDAYDAYLRGLYFIRRREGELAVSYFRKAIALEPEYGAAHAGLAEALVTQSLASGAHDAEIMPSALAAAKRAIELDPNDGEAYTALGAVDTNYLLDWSAAEQNLRKGIALSPSSSDAQTWFAVYLTSVGRPAEAVDAMHRAVALDPLSFWANRLLGSMLYYSRRYDESLVALKRASELAPDKFSFVERWNSGNYEMQGRYSDAVAADIKELASELSPQDVGFFRSAFETGGWKGYQEARVKYLLPRSMNHLYMNDLAMSYVRLGNITEAFRWFNKDLDNCCGRTVFDLSADPRLDKIRSDERFRDLLRRVHLLH
jgi:TolB-like protein/DNA-binding winged helix-turn-helix (wHTH) protein/Tfp pilus assembly protein PilF